MDAIVKELSNLENSLQCKVCLKKYKDPVRITVCGHYFCENCLKVQSHICPHCKTYFEAGDVCHNNVLKQAEPILENFKQILIDMENTDSAIIPHIPMENNSEREEEEINNSFEYKRQSYMIKFVDDLCNKVNSKGETPLHIACKRRKLNEVKNILRTNVNINAQDFAGWTPMHEAVETGSLEIVEMLIHHGALLSVPGGEYTTPLHKAVMQENKSLIRLLLKHGADKESMDYFGKKPFECTLNKNVMDIFNENIEQEEHLNNIILSKKIVAFCYHIEPHYKKKLVDAKINILENYDATKVTHFIIRKTHRLSMNILLAIVDGCTIVPQEWIDNFLQNDLFIPILSYTFIFNLQLNAGIQRAMLNSICKLPKLFDGINFFISGHKNPIKTSNIKVTKESLTLLISTGGGQILRRAPTPNTCENIVNYPYHANKTKNNFRCCHYIIYEEDNPPALQYQMLEIKHRSSKWVIECIINFAIIE